MLNVAEVSRNLVEFNETFEEAVKRMCDTAGDLDKAIQEAKMTKADRKDVDFYMTALQSWNKALKDMIVRGDQ